MQLPCLAIHELGLQLGNHCRDWYIQSSSYQVISLYEHTLNFNVCMVMKEGVYHLSRQCLTDCSFIQRTIWLRGLRHRFNSPSTHQQWFPGLSQHVSLGTRLHVLA